MFHASSSATAAFFAGAVTIFCQCSSVWSNPCYTAINIGDPRRSSKYTLKASDTPICDIDLIETVWYRFDVYTGGKIPEECVQQTQCGTRTPIILIGTYPTEENPGPVTAVACARFTDNDECCSWQQNINIMWCQTYETREEFFVYQLKPVPICPMAYCAGNRSLCEAGCSWNGVKQSCSCPAFPHMTEPVLKKPRVLTGDTLVQNAYEPFEKFYPTKFVVDCEIGYTKQTEDDGARFDVTFEVDGFVIAKMTVKSTDPVATLDESYLVGHIGKTLVCSAFPRWEGSRAGGPHKRSNGHSFDIYPVFENGTRIEGNLMMKEGTTSSFWLKPSFPITTGPCYEFPAMLCNYAVYTFPIVAAPGVTKISDCNVVFLYNSDISKEVRIAPILGVGLSDKPLIWHINFKKSNDLKDDPCEPCSTIFKDYIISKITVEIINGDPPATCSSVGDPHIQPFARYSGNMYNIYTVGDFYLLRHARRCLEIQVRHVSCNSEVAACTCGVIAREGDVALGVNFCNSSTAVLLDYHLDDRTQRGTIGQTNSGWQINLLSGIGISVTTQHSAATGTYIDLIVNGLSHELDSYDGLCVGNFNSGYNCEDECNRHSIPAELSFFNPSSTPKCCAPFTVPTCDCVDDDGQSIDVKCSDPAGDYLVPVDLRVTCQSRRKRSTVPPSNVPYVRRTVLLSAPPGGVALFSAPLPRENVTTESATKRCTEAVKTSSAYDLCNKYLDPETIVETCVLDCKLTSNYEWAKAAPRQYNERCRGNLIAILKNPKTQNQDELRSLLDNIELLICPQDCSEHGRCEEGWCLCDKGYIGSDCAIGADEEPEIVQLLPSECRLTQSSCTTIFVQTTKTPTTDSVSCKITFESSILGGFLEVIDADPSISGGVIVCALKKLPFTVKDLTSDTGHVAASVAVSYNGKTYSQPEEFKITT